MAHDASDSTPFIWSPEVPRPRFGVWAPVWGPFAVHHYPGDPFDASWEFNKSYVLDAERLGFDSTLIAQHTLNPLGHELAEQDAWTNAAALAALTSRIEIISAIKPYLYHPVYLAKMAASIEEISRGRFGINLVNAWYKPELEKAGLRFTDHDERYAYGSEWLSVVKRLVAGEEVTHHGKFFNVDGYSLRPSADYRPRPTIYVGGESEPARDLAAAQADVWFVNGQPLDVVRDLLHSVRKRPRTGAPVRFGLSVFVIARQTEAEAQEELNLFWKLAALDAPAFGNAFKNADEKAVMFQTFQKFPHIGTNGGTAAGLVGSYDQVASRLLEFHDIGIELFMIQFQPAFREIRRFAQEIFPRVQAKLSERAAA